MNPMIEKAIQILTERITSHITPDEALKFSQAALNLAHTKVSLDMAPKS
jgi:hypothetical protein